jgi:hypothetical protein
MKATIARTAVALFTYAALATGAQAGFRCDPAPTPIDQQACAAARQGPDELRRFVERLNWMRANLQMSDYVDRQTVETWNARARQQAQQDVRKPALQIATETRR